MLIVILLALWLLSLHILRILLAAAIFKDSSQLIISGRAERILIWISFSVFKERLMLWLSYWVLAIVYCGIYLLVLGLWLMGAVGLILCEVILKLDHILICRISGIYVISGISDYARLIQRSHHLLKHALPITIGVWVSLLIIFQLRIDLLLTKVILPLLS